MEAEAVIEASTLDQPESRVYHPERRGSLDSLDRDVDWLTEKDPSPPPSSSLKQNGDTSDSQKNASDENLPKAEHGRPITFDTLDSESNEQTNDGDNSTGQDQPTPEMNHGKLSDSDQDTPHSTANDEETAGKLCQADTDYPRPQSPSSPRSSPRRLSLEHEGDAVAAGEGGGETKEASGAPQGWDEGADKEDGELGNMSEDQKQAMKEYYEMMLDLGIEVDEEPPEYNVTERVRQLNKELADDPPPVEDERERSIKFKDNLVDLVAPPFDYSEEEEEEAKKEDKNPSQDSKREDSAGLSVTAGENLQGSKTESRSEPKSNSTGKAGEKVLVHRDGSFDLLSPEELTAEEREMYLGPQATEDQGKNERDSQSDTMSTPRSGDSAHEQQTLEPQPPAQPRPQTAPGGRGSHRGRSASAGGRRTQSANPHRNNPNTDLQDFNYCSPYALTPEQKREMAKEHREKEKKQKQEEETAKKEKEKKTEASNDAFMGWLANKRKASVKQRKEESKRERKKKQEQEDEEKEKEVISYEDWKKSKKQQKEKERDLEKQQRQEARERAEARSRKENDKAFKEWLKRKNEDIKNQEREDRQRGRVHRLLARRSRKSQALARAIKQAQSFRYVDYYGYRY